MQQDSMMYPDAPNLYKSVGKYASAWWPIIEQTARAMHIPFYWHGQPEALSLSHPDERWKNLYMPSQADLTNFWYTVKSAVHALRQVEKE